MSKSLCIAICSTGQMGSSFAAVVKAQDESVRLITNLSGRSARTVELAKSAGIEDVGSYEAVLSQADVFLSVLVPDLALRLAKEVADAATTASPLRTRYFVDLNAIAPSSAATGADFFSSTPVSFVDGGIIGGPATASSAPLLVLSGPQAGDVDSLLSPLFLGRTKTVGDKIGQASALKLSYASLTKGVNALALNASLLASEWGVLHAFEDEVAASNPALTKVIERIPRNTAKAFRWVGEMEEISAAYEEAGLEGGAAAFQGIAETYQFVAQNGVLGKEKIEDALAKDRTPLEVFELLASDLDRKVPEEDDYEEVEDEEEA